MRRPHHTKRSLRSRTHKAQEALVVGVASPDYTRERKLQVLRKFSRVYIGRRADSQRSPRRKLSQTQTHRATFVVGHARRGGGPRPLFQDKGGFRATQETTKLRPWYYSSTTYNPIPASLHICEEHLRICLALPTNADSNAAG